MDKYMDEIDVSLYDQHPISTLIYEVVNDEKGQFVDYRIVYVNEAFVRDYRRFYDRDDYLGAYIIKNHLMDDYSLMMMGEFRYKKPHSFSTFLPTVNVHVHYDPIPNLQEPYAGFFVTRFNDYDDQEARVHFLKVIRQMNNNACLLHLLNDGQMKAVYVTPAFIEMMECTQFHEAMTFMSGDSFYKSVDREDVAGL